MLKIGFFGASVTQQKEGFPQFFKQLAPNHSYAVHGFGSRHLSDAGIIYIDKVLAWQPNLLVIDWYSTGFIELRNQEYIIIYTNSLIHKCIKNGTIPLFLFLPQLNMPRAIYEVLKNHLKYYNVPLIDLSEFIQHSHDLIRDEIHTTSAGGQIYAKCIIENLLKICPLRLESISDPGPTDYLNIKSFGVHKEISTELNLYGSGKVLGIEQIIGPYSGYVLIGNKISNNWDRWCHYEREMIKMRFKINGHIKITVLQHEFDRYDCEHECVWSESKLLKLMTGYYVGSSCQVISGW